MWNGIGKKLPSLIQRRISEEVKILFWAGKIIETPHIVTVIAAVEIRK